MNYPVCTVAGKQTVTLATESKSPNSSESKPALLTLHPAKMAAQISTIVLLGLVASSILLIQVSARPEGIQDFGAGETVFATVSILHLILFYCTVSIRIY